MVRQTAESEACPKWLSDLATFKSMRELPAGRDPALVDRVCEQVHDDDVSVRLNATRSLGSISPHGNKDVIDALLGDNTTCGLSDSSSLVRAAAAETLGAVASGSEEDRVCELLIQRFEDADWAVRASALNALVRVVGQENAEEWLLDRLLECINGGVWSCVTEAAEALGRLSPKEDKRVLQSLMSLFDHSDWAVRKSCAIAVGRVADRGNRRAMHALLPLLGDADWRVRKAALEALPEIVERGCEEGVSAILRRLDDAQVGAKHTLDIMAPHDQDVQLAAVGALGRVAWPRDARVSVALQEALHRARNTETSSPRLEQQLGQTILLLSVGEDGLR